MVHRCRPGGAFLLTLLLGAALSAQPLCASPKDVHEILRASRDGNPPDLDALVRRLEPMDPVTVAALRVALLDEDPFIRATSVRVLGRIGDPSPKSMARLLEDPDEEVRQAAGEALVAVGEHCVEHLHGLFADPGTRLATKQQVAALLGKIGHPDSAGPLCDFLKRNRAGGPNRDIAMKALAGIGAPAVRPLLALLKYRSLQRDIYFHFFGVRKDHLLTALLDVMNDGGAEPAARVLAAELALDFLGSGGAGAEIHTFAGSAEMATFPADQREGVKKLARKLPRRGAPAYPPLTRREIKAKFDRIDDEAAAEEAKEAEREAREEARKDAARRRYDSAKRAKGGRPSPSSIRSLTSGGFKTPHGSSSSTWDADSDNKFIPTVDFDSDYIINNYVNPITGEKPRSPRRPHTRKSRWSR